VARQNVISGGKSNKRRQKQWRQIKSENGENRQPGGISASMKISWRLISGDGEIGVCEKWRMAIGNVATMKKRQHQQAWRESSGKTTRAMAKAACITRIAASAKIKSIAWRRQ